MPGALLRWAERDGLKLCVTAIDPDPRAAAFARSLPPSNVRFEQTDTGRLAERGATFRRKSSWSFAASAKRVSDTFVRVQLASRTALPMPVTRREGQNASTIAVQSAAF